MEIGLKMDVESKYFLKMGGLYTSPLKLKKYKHKTQPLKTFIRWYLDKGWKLYATVNVKNGKEFVGVGKYRSLGDIYRLCYYYYPSVTFIEVRRLVLKSDIVGHFCPNICRRVFISRQSKPYFTPASIGERDEFGFPIYYYLGPKKLRTRDDVQNYWLSKYWQG